MLVWSALAVLSHVCLVHSWKYPDSEAHDWIGTCVTGERQSPIDLSRHKKATIHAPIRYKNYATNAYHNNKFFNGKLENNGHSMVWHISTNADYPLAKCMRAHNCPSIQDGPFGGRTHSHAYYLVQLHFHWGQNRGQNCVDPEMGSEHTVDGKAYPLEMHMVHVEDRYVNEMGGIDWAGATSDKYGLAVLGVFFHVEETKPQVMQPLDAVNKLIPKLWNHHARSVDVDDDNEHLDQMRNIGKAFDKLFATEATESKDEATADKDEAKRGVLQRWVRLRLNPFQFVRKATNRGWNNRFSRYWTYTGSLTTPNCAEAVTWVVFERSLAITRVQVNSFTVKGIRNNYRMARAATEHHCLKFLLHDEIPKSKMNKGLVG